MSEDYLQSESELEKDLQRRKRLVRDTLHENSGFDFSSRVFVQSGKKAKDYVTQYGRITDRIKALHCSREVDLSLPSVPFSREIYLDLDMQKQKLSAESCLDSLAQYFHFHDRVFIEKSVKSGNFHLFLIADQPIGDKGRKRIEEELEDLSVFVEIGNSKNFHVLFGSKFYTKTGFYRKSNPSRISPWMIGEIGEFRFKRIVESSRKNCSLSKSVLREDQKHGEVAESESFVSNLSNSPLNFGMFGSGTRHQFLGSFAMACANRQMDFEEFLEQYYLHHDGTSKDLQKYPSKERPHPGLWKAYQNAKEKVVHTTTRKTSSDFSGEFGLRFSEVDQFSDFGEYEDFYEVFQNVLEVFPLYKNLDIDKLLSLYNFLLNAQEFRKTNPRKYVLSKFSHLNDKILFDKKTRDRLSKEFQIKNFDLYYRILLFLGLVKVTEIENGRWFSYREIRLATHLEVPEKDLFSLQKIISRLREISNSVLNTACKVLSKKDSRRISLEEVISFQTLFDKVSEKSSVLKIDHLKRIFEKFLLRDKFLSLQEFEKKFFGYVKYLSRSKSQEHDIEYHARTSWKRRIWSLPAGQICITNTKDEIQRNLVSRVPWSPILEDFP